MPDVTLNHNALVILAMCQKSHPSVRDLRRATGIRSLNGVTFHLKRLRKLGLLTWDKTLCRTLRPTFTYTPAEELP